MRVQVCDSDEGGNSCQKNVEYGCTVRQYFSSQKIGANIKDYTVLINSRPADAEAIISEGCQLVINKKKMVGARRRR